MLRGTVAFLVLVACALLGSELRAMLARRGMRAPAMEGVSFLAVGFALSEGMLGLFPGDVLASLRVVVLLGLAWIGLVFGLQVELRIIRQLQPWHRRLGWLAPLALGAVVAAIGIALQLSTALALGLSAVAMASSPTTLEGLSRGRSPRDRSALRLLKLVMAFAGLPAVVVFAVASVLASPVSRGASGVVPHWQLLFYTLGLGVVAGYLALVMVRGETDRISVLTMLTGAVSGLAGAAALLGASALPAAACCGAVLINRSAFPHRVLRVAHALERPLLVALLVLVGASWSGVAFSWPVFVVMLGGRWVGVAAAGALLRSMARRRGVRLEVVGVGWGLLPQGELALGLLVALVGFVGPAEGVVEAVVAAIVLHQLAGQWWMRRSLFVPVGGGA
jgi:hypothetical protein